MAFEMAFRFRAVTAVVSARYDDNYPAMWHSEVESHGAISSNRASISPWHYGVQSWSYNDSNCQNLSETAYKQTRGLNARRPFSRVVVHLMSEGPSEGRTEARRSHTDTSRKRIGRSS